MRNHLDEYETYLYQQELSGATIAVYLREAEKFLKFVNERCIDKSLVLAYKKCMMEQQLAVATVNQHIIAVNRYLRYSGYSNCVIKTKRVQRHTSIRNVISESDYLRLLEYARKTEDDKYYAIMKTLALTGIRVSELQYITVGNMETGHIIVENKGKIREVFLPDCLIRILKEYCSRHHITTGSVFRGNTGNPISRAAIWNKINRMAEKAGVDRKKGHPHGFRHYFALLYMKNYSNLFELADILGHSSLETTRIYAMATVEDKRERMGQLDRSEIDKIQYSVKNVK